MAPTRVFVFADSAIYRAALRHLLRETPECLVVGYSSHLSRHALRLARPDVVLLDATLDVPPAVGLDMVREACPSAQVLLLVHRMDPVEIDAALDSGFSGCLSQDAAAAEIGRAVEAVTRGAHYVSRDVCRHLAAGGEAL